MEPRSRLELETPSLPWKCSTAELSRHTTEMAPYENTIQAAGMHRLRSSPAVAGAGFEPTKAEPSDLQSDPVGRLGNPPCAPDHMSTSDQERQEVILATLQGTFATPGRFEIRRKPPRRSQLRCPRDVLQLPSP